MSDSPNTATDKLKNAIGVLERWLEGSRISTDKSNITLSSERERDYHGNIQPIKIFNANTDWTTKTKYLALILNSKTNLQGTHFLSPAQNKHQTEATLSCIIQIIYNTNLALITHKSALRSTLI